MTFDPRGNLYRHLPSLGNARMPSDFDDIIETAYWLACVATPGTALAIWLFGKAIP